MRRALVLCCSVLALAASAARADGFDRDTLLTDAPAVAEKGTVRVTGAGVGQGKTGDAATGTTGSVTGSIQWAPFAGFAGDVGAYYQARDSGPSARVRYQFLKQADFGVDLSGGVRFKTYSFQRADGGKDHGEIEFIVAAGRRFGQWDLVVNGVFGMELGGGEGKDVELKGFGGYRFTDAVRAGVDFRVQVEAGDAEVAVSNTGREYELTTGPAVSWQIGKNFQLQALAGMMQAKKMNTTVPVGVLSASIDF
jgi:hypothetical protein